MIRRDDRRLVLSGAATYAGAAQLLAEGLRELRAGADSVDLAGVTEMDSSLLAALLAWMREARRAGVELRIVNLPEGLATLASLYGVAGLLRAG